MELMNSIRQFNTRSRLGMRFLTEVVKANDNFNIVSIKRCSGKILKSSCPDPSSTSSRPAI